MNSLLIAAALGGVAAPGGAQDIPSPYDGAVAEFGQRQLGDTLARRRLQQARARHSQRATSGQIAACAQKSRFRAQHGAAHPQVRELYRLCRRIGR